MKYVCVYCGSRMGNDSEFSSIAIDFARGLAEQNLGLVYGGGRVGLMGILADTVLSSGGNVIGIIPSKLFAKEIGHEGLTELFEVNSMHERKALMEKKSHAFVALPGGFGTLDELFEIVTWRQLGIHQKPIYILNYKGFFDPLLNFVKAQVTAGFVEPSHAQLLQVYDSPQTLIERLATSL